jgi:hypothetical protein
LQHAVALTTLGASLSLVAAAVRQDAITVGDIENFLVEAWK